MGSLEEALDYFVKLYDMLPEHAEVVYQMATIYEELEDPDQVGVLPIDVFAMS
jgi:intraflagellar transport protein 88